jgi:hypothetical protein
MWRWKLSVSLLVLAALSCASANNGQPQAGRPTTTPGPGLPPTEPAAPTGIPTPARDFALPDFGAPFSSEKRVISPADIDPATDAVPEKQHVVIYPTGRPLLDPLFVFLSGSGGQPTNNDRILTIAGQTGYRVIGLAYVNDVSVDDRCQGLPKDCPGLVRLENQDGQDYSDYIEVNRANSIEHRLSRLLQALSSRFPGEGWEAYADGDTIRWVRIIVAGFSQGGGQAAFIAGRFHLARAVSLDFGGDLSRENSLDVQPAAWLLEPRVTPPDRQFSILHQANHFEAKRLYHEAIGITAFGPEVLVDETAPPYGWTHTLLTNALPATGSYRDAHVSMANDSLMALDANGIPVLAPAYYYLFAP